MSLSSMDFKESKSSRLNNVDSDEVDPEAGSRQGTDKTSFVQTDIGRKTESKDAYVGPLASALRVDFWLGLCPFYITRKNEPKTNFVSVTVFSVLNILGWLSALTNIRIWIILTELGNIRNIYWCVAIALQTLSVITQIRYYQLLMCRSKNICEMLGRLYKNPKIRATICTLRFDLVGLGLRILTIIMMFAVAFLGLGVGINFRKGWHFNKIIYVHYSYMEFTVTNELSVVREGLAKSDYMTSGQFVIGFSYLVVHFFRVLQATCTTDFILLVTLMFNVLAKEQEKRFEQYGCSSFENPEPSGHDEGKRVLFEDYQKLCTLAEEINSILRIILPSYTLKSIIMVSKCLHAWTLHDWDDTVLIAPQLLKLPFIFVMGWQVAHFKERFHRWILRDSSLELIGHQTVERQMKRDKFSPLGIGMRLFYINTEFVGKFVGMALTYFVIAANGHNILAKQTSKGETDLDD